MYTHQAGSVSNLCQAREDEELGQIHCAREVTWWPSIHTIHTIIFQGLFLVFPQGNLSTLVWHQSEADSTWRVYMRMLDLCKQCQYPSGTMAAIYKVHNVNLGWACSFNRINYVSGVYKRQLSQPSSNSVSFRSIFLTLDISRVTYGESKRSKSFQLWTQNNLWTTDTGFLMLISFLYILNHHSSELC